MTNEINTELQRAEMDSTMNSATRRSTVQAETASCAHGFTRGGGATPA